MGNIPYNIINQQCQIQILEGKLLSKWAHINNKRSLSHLSYCRSCPFPISLSNLVTISMGIPRKGWESRISHSHAHF